ncbi:MAG TPA: hypothetical protein PKN14_11405 [Bacteroidia bacterium]|nr:hypothetical protein [Bacteroidia bacterium]MCB8931785.1 hypothetical protein [Bacteroidia bacterium]OQB59987.1 MAG: hypothetical protein BWX95_02430 [Bacteroidetes bacterium ADurb.Bin141]HNR49840.1 hypothetical protein [Bacteroidia bacterium]HNT83408.1 hypothetical protein [Bacteroidia bacterium]
MEQLFNPFEPLSFSPDKCFLTGNKTDNKTFVPVFPQWLLERYNLHDSGIMLLDGIKMKYSEMVLPASAETVLAIKNLDEITREAFEKGYDAVTKLSETILFQWMARVLYGVLYQDFVYVIKQHAQSGKPFEISALLKQRLKNLVLMMQSLVRPVEYRNFTPWSIRCYKVNISKDIFNYKDETQDLNFCLSMNDFGVVACLQDNGAVAEYNKEVLDTVGNAVLHPAQFEEMYGRFIYSNYLLRKLPDYKIRNENGTTVFELPEIAAGEMKKFSPWQDEIFAQVLANLWKPWGLTMNDIYTFPNSPLSYLINERTYEFIPPDYIGLPY